MSAAILPEDCLVTPNDHTGGAPSASEGGMNGNGGVNGGAGEIGPGTVDGAADVAETRLRAAIAVARYFGTDLDRRDFHVDPDGTPPNAGMLVRWLEESGLVARGLRMRWKQLLRFNDGAPVVLLFNDGSAGLLTGADADRNIVLLKDPRAAQADAPVPVDELRLSQVWTGEVILVRRRRGEQEEDAPFTLGWLTRVVLKERGVLRGLAACSLILAVTSIVPALMVMTVVDKVIVHSSMSTLLLLSILLTVLAFYDTLLSWARRELVLTLSARVDAKLNLHVFSRLLSLPLEFFERSSAGATTYKLGQIWRVREFLTGRLLSTIVDLFTLVILLPVIFWLNATLSWMVLAGAVLIAIIIAAFLPSIRFYMGKVAAAESRKGSVLVETVHGIRTVKSLALEPARKEIWDERVAEAGQMRFAAGKLANWPQTLTNPIELFIQRGVILMGAYLILTGSSDAPVGSLVAFMMIGYRVVQPLVSMAKLLEEMEDVRAAVAQVGDVLNNPNEARATSSGLRPTFQGALSFEDVTFTYPNTRSPALDKVTFSVPAGTMLGVVGRSGSGKSTLTRLLQGVNRDYSGFLKIDGADLREINLTHLRRSFGVVLQDNFLFKGSVRDNIIANRPGLTLEDAVRVARMAGAEEFIERLPQGYETIIEEGSPNLSGGQKQRLAIARALIADPRLMILDEATSALDPESEALVNANLARIAKGRTMVIVSHRLSSLVDCDLILVMERGKVADLAPHKVLVERCSIYRQLWLQQNRHMEPRAGSGAVPVLAQGDD
jgi:HlyB family type I secretion system ABC transporter